MRYSIYKITNNINGKCYVGFTEDIARRWKQHKRLLHQGKKPLYQAFRKYGLQNFTFDVIYESDNRDETLLIKEPYYIKLYDSVKNGYNFLEGGTDPNTPERRQKSRDRMIQNNPMKDPDVKKRNSGMFQKGHVPVITKDRNEKIRQSKLGSKNHNFGKSENSKRLNQMITCPVCSVSMNSGNYKRWHLDKCHPI